MTAMGANRLVVLDPTASCVARQCSRARRLDSLNGKVVGFLSNSKRNADKVLLAVERFLRQQYQLKAAIHLTKPDVSRVIPTAFADDLAQRTDAIITGVGD